MQCKFPAPILPPSPAPHSPPERAETRAGCTLAAHAHSAGSHASTTTRASAPPLVSLDTPVCVGAARGGPSFLPPASRCSSLVPGHDRGLI